MKWNLADRCVVRKVDPGETGFADSVEMTGKRCSLTLDYGTDDNGALKLFFHASFPEFRFAPNMTRDGFLPEFSMEQLPRILVDGRIPAEYCTSFAFDGIMTIRSRTAEGLEITREISPAAEKALFFQKLTLRNTSDRELLLEPRQGAWCFQRGIYGSYQAAPRIVPCRSCRLGSGHSAVYDVFVIASNESAPSIFPDADTELLLRRARIAELTAPLQLKTGIPEIDALFYFCKIRAGESIFQTRSGLLHSPGASYYSGVWCNDQLEYAAPYFALTGDHDAIEASLNAFERYIPFMGHDHFHIPSAIVSEGMNKWEMRGDRGDAAMYAYAAALFMLNSGSRNVCEKLWASLEWCLDYCRKKLDPHGVVASDTDELERRLPAGDANLCTSSLFYGALHYGSIAAAASGRSQQSLLWRREAEEMARNIEAYFGADMGGYATYRYYDGNTSLRSWIGIPLCMGLFARAGETVKAIFSDRLWCDDGCRSDEFNLKHIWDRSTLYCLRGAFRAGFTRPCCEKLVEFSKARLLEAHVPYPVESFALNCRHSSAESALYCRIFTEGILGWEPAGFDGFSLTPHIPEEWGNVELNDIRLYGTSFDLNVSDKNIEVCDISGKCRNVVRGEVIRWPL